MTSPISEPAASTAGYTDTYRAVGQVDRPHGDETKPSFKTTELVAYLAAVVGVLLASAVVGDGDVGDNAGDYFAADKAWWYITLLTIGYMISRGLAKSGTRSRDTDPRNR
jgi:hypothetical protein